jgi:hypothetical protein
MMSGLQAVRDIDGAAESRDRFQARNRRKSWLLYPSCDVGLEKRDG